MSNTGRAGVFISEIDLSGGVAASTGFYGCIQLTSPKGNIERPQLIGRELKLLSDFTDNNTIEIGYDNAFWSALAYLQKSNKLWVSRVQNKASYASLTVMSSENIDFTVNTLSGSVIYDQTNKVFSFASTQLKNQVKVGTPVKFTTGNLPTGLVINTTYYLVWVGSNKFSLATTQANAMASTPVLISLTNRPTSESFTFDAATDILTLDSVDLDAFISTGNTAYLTTDGALPSPVQNNLNYYIKKLDSSNVRLCTTESNANLADIVATWNYTANANNITVTAHGRALNDPIAFTNAGGALPPEITEDTVYYVKTVVDANTITVSATSGGTVITFTGDGTGTHSMQRGFIDFATSGSGTHTINVNPDLTSFTLSTPTNSLMVSKDTVTFNATTDEITLSATSPLLNRLGTAIPVRFTNVGGGLPSPLEADTDYYLIDPNDGDLPNTNYVFKLALTYNDSINNVPLNILTSGTGTSSLNIKILDPEAYNFKTNEALMFYNANPGQWGNALAVRLTDSTEEVDNSFKVEVYKFPDLVTPLESFTCSRLATQKDGYGRTVYIEEVLKASNNIRCNNNSLIDGTIMPQLQSVPIRLQGGDIGDDVTEGQLIQDLALKFSNPDRIPNTTFMDGGRASSASTAYARELLRLSELRGDCVSIHSTPLDLELSSDYLNNLTDYKRITLNANSSWGAIYSPHFKIYDKYNDRNDVIVSPDGYVSGLISETGTNFRLWYPVAGKRRGIVNSVNGVVREFTNEELDELYRIGINPIRVIEGDGIYLWGQKTMLNRPSALDRLNVRLLLTDLEPRVRKTLEPYIFEFNDDPTRSDIALLLNALLQNYQNERGLYGYAVICSDVNNSQTDIDNYILNVWVFVKPTKAAEFIPVKIGITRTSLDFGLAAQLIA